FRFDGVSPPPALFRSESGDDGHTPLTRLSSVRSSFSNAGRELNRWDQLAARSGKGSSEAQANQQQEQG
ncbi:hypothetical protein PMAYCL1PPCAC_11029, partial [Pristionchus mayeri]